MGVDGDLVNDWFEDIVFALYSDVSADLPGLVSRVTQDCPRHCSNETFRFGCWFVGLNVNVGPSPS